MLQRKSINASPSKIGNTKLLLFLIVMFGLVLRLVFFSGIGTSDDLAYTKYAADIGKDIDPNSTLTLSTRLGLIYATALSYKLLGINDFSSVLFVLLTSIGSIILIFYFGKMLFNERAGLMAAFLLSFFPLDVVYATKLLTDLPSAFFMALGVYLFLYSEIRKNQRFFGHQKFKKCFSEKFKYNLGYFFSGIFIGVGYLIRESVLLIALFFIAYVIYKRKIKKQYFLVPLGILIIFAIEILVFFALTGDPLFRIHASQQYLAKAVTTLNYFGRLDFPSGLFHYPYIILTDSLISFFYIPTFIAIIYLLIYKKKETYILVFWFLFLLIYLSFGSSSFSQYIPFKATSRYLTIVTMPLLLLLSFFLTEKKDIIKKIMPLTLIILVLTSVTSIYLHDERNVLSDLRESYPYLKEIELTIYTDDRSVKALNYILKYENDVDIKEYPDDLSKVKDSYILVNKAMIKRLKEAYKNRKFPEEINDPPENWRITKEIGEDKIIVYYAS